MTDIFSAFDDYGAELNKPALEDGQTYPAVLVDGPNSSDLLSYLHAKVGDKGVSLGLWFTFAVDKTGEAAFHEAKNLVTVRQYMFLGYLDTRGETDTDRIKAGFIKGEYNFIGTPSPALRNLRSALFSSEELLEMGPISYDFDAFQFRVVNVVAVNADNPTGGKPYTNIKRFVRYTDIMGNVGMKVQPDDVAWTKREEQEKPSENLF